MARIPLTEVAKKPDTWYFRLFNKWVALLGVSNSIPILMVFRSPPSTSIICTWILGLITYDGVDFSGNSQTNHNVPSGVAVFLPLDRCDRHLIRSHQQEQAAKPRWHFGMEPSLGPKELILQVYRVRSLSTRQDALLKVFEVLAPSYFVSSGRRTNILRYPRNLTYEFLRKSLFETHPYSFQETSNFSRAGSRVASASRRPIHIISIELRRQRLRKSEAISPNNHGSTRAPLSRLRRRLNSLLLRKEHGDLLTTMMNPELLRVTQEKYIFRKGWLSWISVPLENCVTRNSRVRQLHSG